MIIVDTSVWIQYLNGKITNKTDKLDEILSSEIVTIGDLIYMEILQGISNSEQFNKTKKILDKLDRVTLGGFEMAHKAAINYSYLRAKGVTIRKSIDILIATFCHENSCKLLHDDKDFDYFSDHIQLIVI